MRSGFINEEDDIQWLKDTALKGLPLPADWAGFRSAVIQGNEDAPYAVNLYKSIDPNHYDDYLRVRFVNDSGAHAEACVYNGRTDKPYGGLSPLV